VGEAKALPPSRSGAPNSLAKSIEGLNLGSADWRSTTAIRRSGRKLGWRPDGFDRLGRHRSLGGRLDVSFRQEALRLERSHTA
jgi:hypothetical protein